MKRVKVLSSLIIVVAILLATTLPAKAIGFVAEEAYESVFVVYSGNSLGSGFAVGKDCIITNAHVIGNEEDVTILTYGGEEYDAYVIGIDEKQDIAVLGVSGVEFPCLEVVDISSMNTGDDVYAIGAPKSMAYTLTKGVISAKEREVGLDTYIQIDAAINEGNSGGPLLNDSGQVIGVNTLKMSDSEGIGLAIPIDRVFEYINELGIQLDEDGNMVGESAVVEDKEDEKEDETTAQTESNEKSDSRKNITVDTPVISIVMVVVFGIVIVGAILLIVLVYRKKRNVKLKYDPRERTDFDIDILE